ncbi:MULTISPECIES: DUF4158 domain-containing protein [unclassified Streptomyces]|uniref:DUF4158 domain-containing protein n=1 Tax=unclassified Streptomyces TaxID=2593676 RepID=UPI003B63E160
MPSAVVGHVRECAGLPEALAPAVDSARTAKRYRSWIRERLGLVRDPGRVRRVVEQAMEAAAPVKAHTADLVNVALEELVRAGLELPGFSTLDRMAATVRTRWRGRSARGSRVG